MPCPAVRRRLRVDAEHVPARSGAAVASGPVAQVISERLVAYLNRQSDAVNSVKYPRVLIDVQAGRDSFTLNSSSLICQKPRNLSLIGGKAVLPGDLVNAGSNSNEFWIYSKFTDGTFPKYVYSSHEDFERGVAQLPFPFDADWCCRRSA